MVLTAERCEVLLLHARAATCPDCAAVRLLLPTGDPGGYCCSACDAAVHVDDLDALEGRPSGDRPAGRGCSPRPPASRVG